MKLLWTLLVPLIFIFFLMPGLVLSQIEIESNINVTVTIPEGLPTPSPIPGVPGLGGVIVRVPTKVIFQGKAYPRAFLTLLKDDKVTATFLAEGSGLFQKELTGISGGTYTFGIFGQDTDGRRSVTSSFTISILEGAITTISGIFLSPTISLAPIQVKKGERLEILGQAFPESQVKIFITPREIVEETTANREGKWIFELDTSQLKEGNYRTKAMALYLKGEQSPFSQELSFLVLSVCRGADLNFDGEVNIVDFSILLYFWDQDKPANPCADINSDGMVDIVDFSIMMYWWTG